MFLNFFEIIFDFLSGVFFDWRRKFWRLRNAEKSSVQREKDIRSRIRFGFIKRNSGSDVPVCARSAVHCIIQLFSVMSSAISFAPKRKPCRNPSRSVSVISLLYLSESSDIFSFCPLSIRLSPNASSIFTTSDNAFLTSSLCGYTGTPTRPRGGERRSRAAYKPCHTWHGD